MSLFHYIPFMLRNQDKIILIYAVFKAYFRQMNK